MVSERNAKNTVQIPEEHWESNGKFQESTRKVLKKGLDTIGIIESTAKITVQILENHWESTGKFQQSNWEVQGKYGQVLGKYWEL